MSFDKRVVEVIRQRFSCRTYGEEPIAETARQRLAAAASAATQGPLGTPARFALVSATEEDRRALRGLGTYGFIRGATGFIVGAAGAGLRYLEDWGYRMEELILVATDLGLGTCWLGGSFTRSSFERKLGLHQGEEMPAVAAVGHIAERRALTDRFIRRQARARTRLPWEKLFFRRGFGAPLTAAEAGPYATPLEMVRIGPSASNKQPWRIVQKDDAWHFFLQRTPNYAANRDYGVIRISDLQRVDIGIAMCHFELTARELGLAGNWTVQEPTLVKPDTRTVYVVSWVCQERSSP